MSPLVKRRVVGMLTSIVGISLSMTVFVAVQDRLRQKNTKALTDNGEVLLGNIKDHLITKLEALRSIAALYTASKSVERGEFAAFTDPILSHNAWIYALDWMARVPAAERAAFEAAARAEGAERFRIMESMEGGSFTDATQRPEYFPIAFSEPDGPNRALLGFDVATVPERWAAMERARDTGEPSSTNLTPGIADASDFRVVMYVPVYRNGLPHDTVAERREHLTGFVSMVLSVPDLLEAALAEADTYGMSLIVEPPWSGQASRRVCHYPAKAWEQAPFPDVLERLVGEGIGKEHYEVVTARTLHVADRVWTFGCVPAAAARRSQQSWQGWVVLCIGLLFTGLLTAYLMSVLGRSEVVEALIAKRTAEWVEANRQLEQQIAERLRLEREQQLQHEALQRTNQKLAAQQEAMRSLLEEIQGSKIKLEAHNQELASREQVMQSLLEDLNTAKERIEEQTATLQSANEKLKGLAVLKDEFVAKVSHELRTPLTSVKEGISLMLDGALGETTADQRDFLQTMDGDVDRLTELINNMLDISKIEAGRMRLFRARMEMPKLVESVLKSYQALLGKRTVRIEAPPGPSHVFGDAHRLTQVLTNLLSNAIKFTPDGGRILFRLEQRNGVVAVEVEDSGPGIAPDDLAKLFQKFSQVGQPAGGGPRGTGLGLVVCKELTELHGGRIEVASQVGVGTTFTVSLPLYTDAFALSESFHEQLQLASAPDGPTGVTLVAVDARPLLEAAGSPSERAAVLEQVTADVRQHLHRGDSVLLVEPAWVVALSATDAHGVQAIITRLREKLREGGRLRFGASVHPAHGPDAAALFAYATAHLNQELAADGHEVLQ